MSPATQKPSPNPELNLLLFSIPQSLLLQIGTASILLLCTAGNASVKALEAMGQASEELFRGDRLPILDFPEDNEFNHS
ncbi:hypothetical protein NIES37_43040 [Tolypothrix tenuis PCC 7101]|uniref:Uncharacterized protein n=1 Tax=Tolypothrix tenuis PCC 7101 TaxID=231146 RepID=A0A1Z4N3Q8_9CYAN|nr:MULTISPECIES: hypothetical protein [unclassified Tolypothrix]MBD2214620.1 hypothetical protein [Nostoc linckia FACHB-104]MBD2237322.1 hypothetical protein [Aulosira sp. FACHB-113]MBD2338132.1 hypothetical protein [Calothrix sp. FACHB-156]BAY91029.1 hypothetical protein NIES3275_30490 [Microchaete diplosiphon NIES-3275]BAZ00315.1 hypothetical protein NIES37_43040 [Tolypothrix tenuis PCC 7101]BAZ75764.1 hypothetical protein NIES50_43550 [Aulosira laxa NIES-50]